MNRGTSELMAPPSALPMNLAVAREALVDGQRTSLPGSPQWQAVQALIEVIDELMPRLPICLTSMPIQVSALRAAQAAAVKVCSVDGAPGQHT